MKTLLILVVSLLAAGSLKSQAFPYEIYDSDNIYDQFSGERLLERNGDLIVVGNVIDTLNNRAEKNMHISKFDSQGTLERIEVWNNPAYVSESILVTGSEFHIYGDELILPN